MSIKRYWLEQNGDMYCKHFVYLCDICGTEIDEQDWGYEEKNDYNLCSACAFIQGKFTEAQFLASCGIGHPSFHACVVNGEIEIWTGRNKTPPSMRTKKEQRHTERYSKWRTSVYERDNYTCQLCFVRGSTLNAHHIKPFSKFPKLRYKVDNGITLCEKCHKNLHRKR